jgi:hypothetical protein
MAEKPPRLPNGLEHPVHRRSSLPVQRLLVPPLASLLPPGLKDEGRRMKDELVLSQVNFVKQASFDLELPISLTLQNFPN